VDSLDHVRLADSYTTPSTGGPYDFFYLNGIEQDDDGNLISARSTSALYKVNYSTGAVMWQLGGKRSSFKFGANPSFAFAMILVCGPRTTRRSASRQRSRTTRQPPRRVLTLPDRARQRFAGCTVSAHVHRGRLAAV
jgi:hypothetical protein